MAKIDKSFNDICEKILNFGKTYRNVNRDVERLQIPSYTFKHSFKNGFPALTNKKLYWEAIVGELIWFLTGNSNIKYLLENDISIWNKDAYNWYLNNCAQESDDIKDLSAFIDCVKEGIEWDEELKDTGYTFGDVGRNYGVQWRDFNGVDQIKELVKNMKKDIMSSRLKVNAWNPAELELTTLPPCHSEFQIVGVPLGDDKFGFELHWTQRSCDVFLGVPFNIASYALLAKILEQLTGFEALGIEGNLKCVHFYDNQYEAVKELLSRDPEKHPNCEVSLPKINNNLNIDEIFNNYKISDFKLIGYTSDKAINVEMLAPNGKK